MTEGPEYCLPWPIIAAAVTGAVSILVFALTNWRTGERERVTRNREVFSKAYAAIQEYKEFPYVIRRRRSSTPEEERLRISSELRKVQSDLAFYCAWLRTESHHVNNSYAELVQESRRVAGAAIREAWLRPGCQKDSEMNVQGLDLSSLASYEAAYLSEVVDHLSFWPRWLRQPWRKRWAHVMSVKGKMTGTK